MAGNDVIAGAALVRGIRNTFANQWQKRYAGLQARLAPAMELGIESTNLVELYGHYESAPYPERVNFGDPTPSRPFRARNFEVENLDWRMSVTWSKHIRHFDQLKGLERQARQAGGNFVTIAERVLFQILLATVDPRLLEAIPNAPDGVPIYSALDGDGNPRFGVAGGNREVGVDFTTAQGVRNGIFNGLERIGQFQDTEGEPAVDPDIVDQGFTVYAPMTRMEEFRTALFQNQTLDKITGTAGADVSVAAGVSNIFIDRAMPARLVSTSRITVDQAFIFIDAFEPKPVFEQVALALDEEVQIEGNSDRARIDKQEGVFWESYRGFGLNLPLPTVDLT